MISNGEIRDRKLYIKNVNRMARIRHGKDARHGHLEDSN